MNKKERKKFISQSNSPSDGQSNGPSSSSKRPRGSTGSQTTFSALASSGAGWEGSAVTLGEEGVATGEDTATEDDETVSEILGEREGDGDGEGEGAATGEPTPELPASGAEEPTEAWGLLASLAAVAAAAAAAISSR